MKTIKSNSLPKHVLQSDVQPAVIQFLYKLQLKEIWPEDFPTRTDLLPAIGHEEHYMQVWKQPICAYLEPWLFRFTDKGNWYQKGMKTFLMLREVLKDFFWEFRECLQFPTFMTKKQGRIP